MPAASTILPTPCITHSLHSMASCPFMHCMHCMQTCIVLQACATYFVTLPICRTSHLQTLHMFGRLVWLWLPADCCCSLQHVNTILQLNVNMLFADSLRSAFLVASLRNMCMGDVAQTYENYLGKFDNAEVAAKAADESLIRLVRPFSRRL